MIMCDRVGCEGWFHYTCENLTEALVTTIQQYACKGCRAAGTAHATYKDSRDGGHKDVVGSGVEGSEKQQSPFTGSKRKASAQFSLPNEEHKKAKKSESEKHATSDRQDEPEQNGHQNSTPSDPDADVYQKIVDKLNVDPQYLEGFSSSDTEHVVRDATAIIEDRMTNILDRNQAIHAQIGLMEIMYLDDSDFAAVRAHPLVARKFLETHLERVIDVQYNQIRELENEVVRLKQEDPDSKAVRLDLWKVFGYERQGSKDPLEGEVDTTG